MHLKPEKFNLKPKQFSALNSIFDAMLKDGWNYEDLDKSLDDENISLSADNYRELIISITDYENKLDSLNPPV